MGTGRKKCCNLQEYMATIVVVILQMVDYHFWKSCFFFIWILTEIRTILSSWFCHMSLWDATVRTKTNACPHHTCVGVCSSKYTARPLCALGHRSSK